MNVHFGVVQKYFSEKGFGFVTHPLDSRTRKDVFFHISNVQKFSKDIADKLSVWEIELFLDDHIYFYYEAENTSKGEQVKSILPRDGIRELLKSNLHDFTQKLTYTWQDIKTPQPTWLCDVTQDLIGTDGLNKLKLEREEKKKEVEELKRKEIERIEEEKRKQLELQERERKIEEEEQERQRKIEDEEFESLVAEIKSKGFTMSWQVSNYIIQHRLGDKYKHISGVLTMANNGTLWKFNGGFSPDIYGKLCHEIGLGNKGTNSKVAGFRAFKDL
jgi:cold shock CspA family protein